MIRNEFKQAFDICKQKIEYNMYLYDGTEFYKYFYQSRKILLELTTVEKNN